jgi:hypothetical protein
MYAYISKLFLLHILEGFKILECAYWAANPLSIVAFYVVTPCSFAGCDQRW